MIRITTVLALTAALGTVGVAQSQGRSGGPPPAGIGGGVSGGVGGGLGGGGFGSSGAATGAGFGASIRDTARSGNQSINANDEARVRANANSPLGSATISGSTSTTVNRGRTERETARAGRAAPSVISPKGAANANANAGFSSATASSLANLKTGLTVRDGTGATIGTVSKIEKSADGTVRSV